MTKQQDDIEAINRRAIRHAEHNDTAGAEVLLRRAMSIDPGNPLPYLTLATIYGRLGEFERALEYSRIAISLSPGYGPARALLGRALTELGRSEEAIRVFESALEDSPDDVHLLNCLASACLRAERPEPAIACYSRILVTMPDDAMTLNNLGAACHKAGRLDEAIAACRKAIERNPRYVLAYVNLGRTHERAGNTDAAISAYRAVLSLDPENSQALHALGNIYLERGLLDEARHCYGRCVELENGIAEHHYNLGYVQAALGRLDEAMNSFTNALRIKPDYDDPVGGIAGIYQSRGEFGRAHELLKPLVERGTGSVTVAWNYAALCGHYSDCDAAIALLERLKEANNQPAPLLRLIYFSLGRLYDRRRKYELAFMNYRSGNELKGVVYDHHSVVNGVDRSISYFTAAKIRELPVSGCLSEQPVFIVGMPRSGTTLVEQILASHPDVYGAGELPAIDHIVARLQKDATAGSGYPFCLDSMNQQQVESIAREYLDFIRRIGGDTLRITDKMMLNYRYLGLIRLVFPGARIIHCKRNSLDTCLSIYFQDFAGAHDYAYKLNDIGKYYVQYERLMSHWKSVLDSSGLDIVYEDLVADPEGTSRKLVEYCGLPWNDRCLEFYDVQRSIVTASVRQVRRPIYSGSVNYYRHYERYLDELREALGRTT